MIFFSLLVSLFPFEIFSLSPSPSYFLYEHYLFPPVPHRHQKIRRPFLPKKKFAFVFVFVFVFAFVFPIFFFQIFTCGHSANQVTRGRYTSIFFSLAFFLLKLFCSIFRSCHCFISFLTTTNASIQSSDTAALFCMEHFSDFFLRKKKTCQLVV